MIFWGILSSVFNSIYEILYKKSLNFKPSFKVNEFLYGLGCFIGGLAIYFIIKTDISRLIIPFITLLIMNITRYFSAILNQKVYSKEKISKLMPYTKLNSVVGIILAFVFLGKSSLFSFIIAILIIFLTIGVNIDFKKLKLSKTIGLFLLVQLIRGFIYFGYGFVLKNVSAGDYFVMEHLIYGIVGFVSFIFIKTSVNDFKLSKKYYKIKTFEIISRLSETFIWAFLMSNLGLISTSILGFLGMGITLIMAYFVFGDKPNKKDLTLTIIITILVFLGFYFK